MNYTLSSPVVSSWVNSGISQQGRGKLLYTLSRPPPHTRPGGVCLAQTSGIQQPLWSQVIIHPGVIQWGLKETCFFVLSTRQQGHTLQPLGMWVQLCLTVAQSNLMSLIELVCHLSEFVCMCIACVPHCDSAVALNLC
jgi:hypothetical protein